jgi:transcriptional regulator GlxA family with amidase domain
MSGQSASAVADRSSPAIHLLVLPRVHLLDLAGPAQVFASEHLNCRLSYISPQSALRSSQGLSLCELQALPGEVAADSWLVVIGSSLMEQQLRSNELRSTIDWLHNAQHKYRRLAAVCSGSLLLGKAGLLDGVRCTTHHDLTGQLRSLAPRALVQDNTLFVEHGRTVTSAGISTGIDLSLHLVAQHWGARLAQTVARDMVVYQRRHGDAQTLSFWLQHRNHVEQQIHAIQDQLMANPGHDWRLTELAAQACLSERQFRRRFEQATGVKVQAYIRLARLELSRQLLTQTTLGLDRIAERCGFGNERSLRRLWQQLSGESPNAFRKNNRAAATEGG